MRTMLLGIWNDFTNWVTLKWSSTTFAVVVGVFALIGLWGLLTFFKGSINKGKKPKWGSLALSVVMFVLLAVVCMARYVK